MTKTKVTDSDLQRYFDGELSPRRARRVHRHLAECPEDRQRLASLGQMREMLRSAAEDIAEEASFAVNWERIRTGIAEEPARGSRGLGLFLSRRWIGGAVAVATLIVVVVLFAVMRSADVPRPRNDCEIETLEVGPQAVSTIFTIEDDTDPVERDQMTVIWVSEASAVGEDPEGSPGEGI